MYVVLLCLSVDVRCLDMDMRRSSAAGRRSSLRRSKAGYASKLTGGEAMAAAATATAGR